MKKIIKSLLLTALAASLLAGCDNEKSSSSSSAQESSISSSVISSSDSASSSSSIDSSTSSSSSSSSSSSVIAPTLTGISINTENVKKSYHLYDALDLAGLVVTASYDNNTSKVISDYTTNPINGAKLNNDGEQNVTVIYQSFNESFVISVDAGSAAMSALKVKTNYYQGDTLDLTGLEVYTQFADGTKTPISVYTSTPAHGDVLNEIGTTTVYVSFKNNKGEDKTFQFSITVSKAPKRAWTDEEASVMSSHLNGVVLPYTGYEESKISYSEEDDKVYILGGAKEAGFISNYVSKLKSLGFEEYFIISGESCGMEKAVTTDHGVKHVYVYVGFEENQLYIEAYDPYFYEFPTAFVQYIASKYFSSDTVVPSITADYYETSEDNLCVICYLTASKDDAGYSAILTAANWDVQSEKSDDGYYIAIAPDRTFEIAYLYTSGKLRIYIEPVFFWNADSIRNFILKYDNYAFDVPALNISGAQYQFVESPNNALYYASGIYEAIHAWMYIYGGQESDLATYAATLNNAGWDVYNENDFYYCYLTIADKGIARVEFEYSKGTIVITIYSHLDPLPLTSWPAEEVNKLLGQYLNDVVPAFSGANRGFTILNDVLGTGVMVNVDRGTEYTAVASYIQTLTVNGYTKLDEEEYGLNYYLSPNREIIINVYSAQKGSITIDFRQAPLSAFPSNVIDQMFNATNDTVPVEIGASSYNFMIADNDGNLTIVCHYSSKEEAIAAVNAYTNKLLDAEYTEHGTIASYKTYASKNKEFYITPYNPGDNNLYLLISGPLSPLPTFWPASDIAELFAAKGYTDALPEYNGAYQSAEAYTNYDGSIGVIIYTSNAGGARTAYAAQLVGAGFIYIMEDNYGDPIYNSPNGQYEIALSVNRFGLILTIKKIQGSGETTSVFPMDEIIKDFPTAKGVLPTIVNEDATFKYANPFSGEATITVTFSSETFARTALNAYKQALLDAHFTFESLWGGYLEAYVAPDRSFAVELSESKLANGIFEITLMTLD